MPDISSLTSSMVTSATKRHFDPKQPRRRAFTVQIVAKLSGRAAIGLVAILQFHTEA
jgi:hypothetical protein